MVNHDGTLARCLRESDLSRFEPIEDPSGFGGCRVLEHVPNASSSAVQRHRVNGRREEGVRWTPRERRGRRREGGRRRRGARDGADSSTRSTLSSAKLGTPLRGSSRERKPPPVFGKDVGAPRAPTRGTEGGRRPRLRGEPSREEHIGHQRQRRPACRTSAELDSVVVVAAVIL